MVRLTMYAVLLLLCQSATAQEGDKVGKLMADLKANPGATIERMNHGELEDLMKRHQFRAVEDLAMAGTLALPADTWRIEVLQAYRVKALLAEGKNDEALHAAKGLFNVCGMGYVKDVLPLLFQATAATHPQDPALVPRFKLQVMAGAQEDQANREKELAKVGGNTVMDSIEADPAPYKAELTRRAAVTEWRDRYGNGNLFLLSGNIQAARAVFDRVCTSYPEGELRYASEAKAKMIKAEDGAVGRANQFVRSIRPSP